MTDPTSLPNFPPPADESPLRGRVLDVLQDEGFRPDLDADGDVSFKVQGQQLFVRCMEGEVPIMRVFGQWQISEDLPQDLEKQLLAANDVTLSLNIIKTGIANGTLVATGEHLVGPDADLKMLVQTTIQMVLQSVQMWHQAVTSEGPHAANGGVPQVQLPEPPAEGEDQGQGGTQA
ncbi:hypothetical protein PZ938_12220 [Luteipulveratus sp. YIM 133132]|uniref:YbjN domain-containing protein n=1 Tax=Luteipulveratus flavus TaxID=3031728 RepID=A0ABT6CAQ8_9MICO|nr:MULTISPECIES: hypothetical protein [unclassified Luteipulveratus]MDE9366368.1 hypothetical protein [Luteipulveratus sp. YIM 133132]MDF8265457.1 hypothetical protein [Luteipulveratus sp. YIM 133296]